MWSPPRPMVSRPTFRFDDPHIALGDLWPQTHVEGAR